MSQLLNLFPIFFLNYVINCTFIILKNESLFHEILPCITNIAERYTKNTNFLFISEEINLITSIDLLFQKLQGTVMIQKFDEFEGKFGFFLFFPEKNKSYRSLLKSIEPFTYNRFLILWPTFLNTSSINRFVLQFWNYKLLNILILVKASEYKFDLYTYDPYSESFCNTPKLILINVWNTNTNKFNHENDLYPLASRLQNLNKCELSCFAKNRPPDSLIVQVVNRTWLLDGIAGKLMEEVRTRINFTSAIQVPKLNVSVDKYGYDISNGFPELVASLLGNSSIDLVFGIYSHIIYDNTKTEFSIPAVSECYGWAVPAYSGKEISVWMYYTYEFQFLVWLLIFVAYIVSVFIFYLMLRSYYDVDTVFHCIYFVALYVFSLNLGMSTAPRIKYFIMRIFMGLILIYSMVLCSAYQSSLGSFLTVPWKREQIKSFNEILDANYVGIGVPQGKRILQRFSEDNEILNKLSERFRVHTDHFDTLVLKMQEEKNIVTFGAQRFIQFYVNHNLNSTGRNELYLLPKCVIQAHASPFLFKKGSPFLKPINNIISRAVESGLTNFWYKYSTPKISSPLATILPLTLHQLQLAFDLIIIGNCLAIVIFIVELQFSSTKSYPNQRSCEKQKRKCVKDVTKFIFTEIDFVHKLLKMLKKKKKK